MLTDCISKDPATAELIVVQRGKAATMAKSVRNRFTQAVLPINRRIVGAAEGELDQVLDNAQVLWIIAALGVGIDLGGTGETFRLDLLRYGKIILALDDDPRGRAIHEGVLVLETLYAPRVDGGTRLRHHELAIREDDGGRVRADGHDS